MIINIVTILLALFFIALMLYLSFGGKKKENYGSKNLYQGVVIARKEHSDRILGG